MTQASVKAVQFVTALLLFMSTSSLYAQTAVCTSVEGIWNFDGNYYFVVESQETDGTLSAWISDPTQPNCGKQCSSSPLQAFYNPSDGSGYFVFSDYRAQFQLSSSCTTLSYTEFHACDNGTCQGTWTYRKTNSIPTP